jgi:hypothetical protein
MQSPIKVPIPFTEIEIIIQKSYEKTIDPK